ncbi:MAG: nitroreductase family protein [Pseudomonadota bacterium]
MSLFVIDPDKCQHDGLCVAECPLAIIEWPDRQAPPRPGPDALELCINCGHCAAVCPHGALSLAAMPLETMPALEAQWSIGPEQAEQFLRSRRSIRVYKNQAVDQATLTRLIEVARHAPSGHNWQPVSWLVIAGAEQLKPLCELVVQWMHWMIKEQPQAAALMHMERVIERWQAGHDGILRGAPQVVLAHAPKMDRTAPAACTLALAYLELMAPTLGLGACWAGFFNAAASMFPPM